ncbi:MAG: autotransporter-associated beta strand repeat-containing protein, partial [Verrucomicrobiota bacterium]|nr:autotransporter-associated beta strand repeat-containing protein [Verrucomicrobiota bacterium]
SLALALSASVAIAQEIAPRSLLCSADDAAPLRAFSEFNTLVRAPRAATSTWSTNPVDNRWFNAANWSTGSVPNDPTTVATFGTSAITNIDLASGIAPGQSVVLSLGDLVIRTPASSYTFSATGLAPTSSLTLAFYGFGIYNDAGKQTFNDISMAFYGSATASPIANLSINESGGNSAGAAGRSLSFYENSTAGYAQITSGGGQVNGASGASTTFTDNATAEHAKINATGGLTSGAGGARLAFGGNSTAADAAIYAQSGAVPGASGASIEFNQNATAGHTTISANSASNSPGTGVQLTFRDYSSAGNAQIGISGGTTAGTEAILRFKDFSTAGNATISGSGSRLTQLYFDDNSSGGTATVALDYGGVFDISQHNGAVTLGALSGRGAIRLGNNDLFVGAGDKSMVLDLRGLDPGSGTLHKIGNGTLAIDNYSYYTGGLYLDAGTLQMPYWLDLMIHQASGTVFKVGNPFGRSFVGGLSGAGTLQLDGLGFSIGKNNLSSSYAGIIQGTTSLTKVGYGTFAFTGDANYAGATDVNSGTFQLNGSLGGSGVTVAGGATLRAKGSITSSVTIQNDGRLAIGLPESVGSLAVGSLLLNERSRIDLRVGAYGDVINVLGGLRLDGVLNILNAGTLDAGVFRLFNYGGSLIDNGVTINTPPGFQAGDFTLQTSVPGQVNLIVLSGVNILYWDGANATANGAVDGGSGTWTNSDTNWTTGSGSMNTAWSPRAAAFSGAPGTVNVADNVTVSGLQFLTSGYTLAAGGGSISLTGIANTNTAAGVNAAIDAPLTGNGSLRKTGAGTLTLAGRNSYTGNTSVEEGALVIRTADGTGLGGGPVSVFSSDSTRLIFAGAASAGSAAITVNGSTIPAQTAALAFVENSGAGTATISNEGNAALGGFGGSTTFNDNARGGNATIINRGPNFQYPYYSQDNIPGHGQTTFRGFSSAEAAVINNLGGRTNFGENASAGSALINNVAGGTSFSGYSSAGTSAINNGVTAIGNVPSVGWTDFYENSSAGSASVTSQGGTFSYSNGTRVFGSAGATSFYDTSSAGNATFHNLVVADGGSEGGRVVFRNASHAAGATFFNDGGASLNGYGAPVYFLDNSTAEQSTIINRGKTTADANTGGRAIFWYNATAGQATITNEGSVFGDAIDFGSVLN